MTNKEKLLKPVPTNMLISWYNKADAGNGVFVYYDRKTLSTINFTKIDLIQELKTRDDIPFLKRKDPHNIDINKIIKEL